jgi:periplasmic protein TonB
MAEKTKTDLDEIVFEKRNKNYGAYFMRKKYNRFVTYALVVACAVILAATIIPYILFKQAHSVNDNKDVSVELLDLTKPPEDAPPPPPPPPPPEALEQKVKFTAPVVTTDSVEDSGALNQDDLNQQSTTTAVTEETEIVVEETENQVIEQQAPILTIVELMPSYEGGEAAMYEWLGNNIKYPQVAKENTITGTVIVTFVVEKDGSITDVKVLKDIGGGCGEEALRVVKMMPKWKAGKQNGVPVRVQFNLPIRFTLE